MLLFFSIHLLYSLRVKFEVCRGGEVESVAKEREKLRDIVMACTNDVRGRRRVG